MERHRRCDSGSHSQIPLCPVERRPTPSRERWTNSISQKPLRGSTGITDFIIPLRIDNLPYKEINVAIHRLNVIDFTKGWATGLERVLKKLEKDRVPSAADRFNPTAVGEWWRERREGGEILRPTPEPLLSNWFPIHSIPGSCFAWPVPRGWAGPSDSKYPWVRFKGYFVSFAPPEDWSSGTVKAKSSLQKMF